MSRGLKVTERINIKESLGMVGSSKSLSNADRVVIRTPILTIMKSMFAALLNNSEIDPLVTCFAPFDAAHGQAPKRNV